MLGSALFLLSIGLAIGSRSNPLTTLYQWKYIDYLWDSEAQKNEFTSSGRYNFSNIVPADVYKVPDGRVFISIVGRTGVPARLTTVSDKIGPAGPLLKPYPSWEWFKEGDCDGITGVYRVYRDECNKLWVLDTGVVEDSDKYSCQPQLLVFDLKTDKLIRRLRIPPDVLNLGKNQHLLSNPIVDTSGILNCATETVYIADTYGKSLIVFHNGKYTRYHDYSFENEADAKSFDIAGTHFDFEGGLLAMALTPKAFLKSQYLIYKPLASYDLYYLNTNTLKTFNKLQIGRYEGLPKDQIISLAVSKEGTVFGSLSSASAVGCFNYKDKRVNLELVAQDKEALQYMNGVHVFPPESTESGEEELWVFSNRFTKFLSEKLSFDDVNFRVLKAPVRELVQGTKC